MDNFGKTAVFLGGYGQIGEIQHGRVWPDWGLKGYTQLLPCIVIENHILKFENNCQIYDVTNR